MLVINNYKKFINIISILLTNSIEFYIKFTFCLACTVILSVRSLIRISFTLPKRSKKHHKSPKELREIPIARPMIAEYFRNK